LLLGWWLVGALPPTLPKWLRQRLAMNERNKAGFSLPLRNKKGKKFNEIS
jgi:hypothetical protein